MARLHKIGLQTAQEGTTEVDVNIDRVRLIAETLPARMDRQLGYFGEEACVLFHYDTRAEEVMWNDGLRYGIGTGGWHAYVDTVEPLAKKYDAVLTGHRAAPQALVIDATTSRAYFADMDQAKRMVQIQHGESAKFETTQRKAV